MSLDKKIAAVLTALTALTALALFAAMAWAADPAGGGVVVRPAVAVRGPEVMVKDICYPVGRKAKKRWMRLKDEVLMASPESLGDQHPYPRDRLARILGERLGREARDFILPQQLIVQRGGEVLLDYQLKLDVVDFLTTRLAGVKGEPGLRDYRLPGFILLEREDNRLRIEVTNEIEPGRLMLRFVEVGPGGPTGRKFTGSVFFDLWTSAPCAARPLNPGDRILPDRIRYERKNMAYMRGEPWDGKSFDLRLKRSVGEGRIIYEDDLELMPVVAEGDEVRLVFRGEYVRLEVPAEALADGRVGEMIRVRNLQSERVVSAKVEDSGTVTVN
jgi:flagella basal body P-ring formation protein FlgA